MLTEASSTTVRTRIDTLGIFKGLLPARNCRIAIPGFNFVGNLKIALETSGWMDLKMPGKEGGLIGLNA